MRLLHILSLLLSLLLSHVKLNRNAIFLLNRSRYAIPSNDHQIATMKLELSMYMMIYVCETEDENQTLLFVGRQKNRLAWIRNHLKVVQISPNHNWVEEIECDAVVDNFSFFYLFCRFDFHILAWEWRHWASINERDSAVFTLNLHDDENGSLFVFIDTWWRNMLLIANYI